MPRMRLEMEMSIGAKALAFVAKKNMPRPKATTPHSAGTGTPPTSDFMLAYIYGRTIGSKANASPVNR